ncbi:tetratricopeptide repeat protein [Rubritalea tangerina]|uniref:Tetratricopeptide repeat protein n=2 Tax=Rubritalea tangerina TaxID=430798 RepID=A0ABW4ZDX6_9BACT
MRLLSTLFLFVSLCLASASQPSPIITEISSKNFIEGEIGYFNLIYRDANPDVSPPSEITLNDGATITQRGFQQSNINGQRFYFYQYPIIELPPGEYTIPPLELEVNGSTVTSLEASFTVHPLDQFKVLQFDFKGQAVPSYSKIFVDKTQLYPGESVELEYKLYIPSAFNTRAWGLPKPDNIDNCTAWRITPPRNRRDVGQAYIDKRRYDVASYTTVISAIKPGAATFGPLKTDLIVSPSSMNSRFGFSNNNQEVPIPSAELQFEVIPFPTTPPTEFDGAVGTFTIEAEFPPEESISLNDSITATVTIDGNGNLSDIQAPKLEDTSTWKLVDVSKVQQGESRKSLVGQTQFTYILQPQRGADSFPRFTFAHFDPVAKEFHVTTTTTSALSIVEPVVTGTAVLPEATIPTEKMQDILGPLASVRLDTPTRSPLPAWLAWIWQVIPATLLLSLIGVALSQKYKKGKMQNLDFLQRKEELKHLESSDNKNFLKDAGSFAERWHPNTPESAKITEARDAMCYQPDQSSACDPKLRSDILKSLKSLSLLVFLFVCIPHPLQANDPGFDSWEKEDYHAALSYYLEQTQSHPQSADLLYNAGDAYYRTNQPGMAALYYKKALKLDPSHYEATKNLEFVQKLQGAITSPELAEIDQWIVLLPPEIYRQIAFAALWALVLSLLTLKLFQLNSVRLVATILVLILSPIVGIAALASWQTHPLRTQTQVGEPAILTQFAHVLTEPIEVSGKELETKTMIKATPSSPCHIIAIRGDWTYIQLANGTRGWVPNNSVSKI